MRLGIGLGLFKQGAVSVGVRLFSAYKSRVIADGGTVEADNCGISALNNGLFRQASLLLIPSGYKGGKAYAEIPTNGSGDLTWTRASDAWRTNANGLIQRVPWNLVQYSEDFSNVNWIKLNSSTITANTTTAPNGTLTADTYQASNLAFGGICRGIAAITITSGQTYTLSFFAKKNNYRYVGIRFNTSINVQRFPNYDFDTDTLNKQGVTCDLTRTLLSDGWVRIILTYTTTSTAGTCDIGLTTANGDTATALAGTEKVDIWGAQLVEGSSAQTYFPTTDRLNVPRLSYMYGSCPALLLEPQRTNSIRNSTMVGASTSPSTLPTNYVVAGLTATVVGIGTENGLSYVDIRFNGTASGINTQLQLETTSSITASNGQTWTESVYLKLINTTTPPTGYNMRMREGTAAGVFVADGITAISPTTTLQRFTYTRTNTGALTERIQPILLFDQVSGNTYDYTIRIAQPQMELGAYATTPILTTTASATRIADSFSRNNIYTNGLITSSGGTWFVELRGNVGYPRISAYPYLFVGSSANGSTGNVIGVGAAASGRPFLYYVQNGTFNLISTTSTNTAKIAFAWSSSMLKVYVNGSLTNTYTGLTWDITSFQNILGIGEIPLFLQQSALFNSTLSDTDCTTLTTL